MKRHIALFLAVPMLAIWSSSGWAQPTSPPCDQSALAQAPEPPAVTPPLVPGAPALKIAYHAIFPGGSLNCFIDRIHSPPQALQQGDGQVPGQTATFPPGTQGIMLRLTAPNPIPPIPGHAADDTQTPSIGLFSTGLNYGPGTFFSARATFIRPVGPFGGRAWAVALNARTGGNNDPWSETRLNMTVKFKKGAASLNAYEDGKPLGSKDVLSAAYDGIVNSSQAFTVELMVSRKTGKGAAILTTAGAAPLTLQFDLATFGAKSGPVISAVGPSLADCCVDGATVSVELIDFRILEHPSTPSHS